MNEEELKEKLESLEGEELLGFIIDSFLENELIFIALEEELLDKRRFFATDLQKFYLTELDGSLPANALNIVEAKEQFFRARYLEREFAEKCMPKHFPFQNSFEECCSNLRKEMPGVLGRYLGRFVKHNESHLFRGMPKEESGAPPAHLVKDGRLNPVNIPFLYTAKEMETAVQEIRPQIGQTVSVATLQTVKPLKILDLTVPVEGTASYFGYHPKTFFEVVSEAFKRPNHDDPKKYLITQYLTEYIRVELKVDGICFWSSLRKGGKNVVFFDTEACVPVSSDLITVEDIEFKLKGFYGE